MRSRVLLGPDVALTHNQFIVKLPGTSSGDQRHPAAPGQRLRASRTAGRHHRLGRPHRHHHRERLPRRRPPVAPRRPRRAQGGGDATRRCARRRAVDTVPLELAAGEAVAFSGMMLHGSGENRTDRRAHRPVRPLLRPPRPDDDPRRQAGARRRSLVDGPRRENRTTAERAALFARYCVPHAVMMIEGGKPVLDDGHSWMVRGEASIDTWHRGNEALTN